MRHISSNRAKTSLPRTLARAYLSILILAAFTLLPYTRDLRAQTGSGPVPRPLGAQNKAPYGPSPVIRGAAWDFEHLIRLANTPGKGGSDLWPTAWAADGNIYTSFGDGGGFRGASDATGRVSIGFARILGFPPLVKGVDIWGSAPKYAEHPATFCGKSDSMLAVDGILYAWVASWYNPSKSDFAPCGPNPARPQERLAWSRDLGATWSLSPWKVGATPRRVNLSGSFLNFGENYAGARDQYVYEYAAAGEGGDGTYRFECWPRISKRIRASRESMNTTRGRDRCGRLSARRRSPFLTTPVAAPSRTSFITPDSSGISHRFRAAGWAKPGYSTRRSPGDLGQPSRITKTGEVLRVMVLSAWTFLRNGSAGTGRRCGQCFQAEGLREAATMFWIRSIW